ncbi:DUF4811 domain-containing protein [Limosilactobacillus kribbianus]|uniref:DUF4811 domain-containing protein n=1 Tax=Limosilactobacillus kribbianus TaxID=2982695 RepID=UPI00226415C1|nr:DUF4811 domain-containing protein [Limosilactobacillus kribbianus]
MIIYVIFALVIVTILAWTLIPNRLLRWAIGILSALALVGAVSVMSANFTSHYGMKKVTTTTTRQIYSAAGSKSPAGVLVTKRLGTKSNRYVLVYADTPSGKAKAHFVPKQKHITTAVKQHATYRTANVKQATLKTTTTRWEWESKRAKFWLNVGDQAGELVSQYRTVTIPQDTWLAVTPNQMKKLQKVMASSTGTTSSQAAALSSLSQDQQAAMVVKLVKKALN